MKFNKTTLAVLLCSATAAQAQQPSNQLTALSEGMSSTVMAAGGVLFALVIIVFVIKALTSSKPVSRNAQHTSSRQTARSNVSKSGGSSLRRERDYDDDLDLMDDDDTSSVAAVVGAAAVASMASDDAEASSEARTQQDMDYLTGRGDEPASSSWGSSSDSGDSGGSSGGSSGCSSGCGGGGD